MARSMASDTKAPTHRAGDHTRGDPDLKEKALIEQPGKHAGRGRVEKSGFLDHTSGTVVKMYAEPRPGRAQHS